MIATPTSLMFRYSFYMLLTLPVLMILVISAMKSPAGEMERTWDETTGLAWLIIIRLFNSTWQVFITLSLYNRHWSEWRLLPNNRVSKSFRNLSTSFDASFRCRICCNVLIYNLKKQIEAKPLITAGYNRLRVCGSHIVDISTQTYGLTGRYLCKREDSGSRKAIRERHNCIRCFTVLYER